MTLAFPSHWFHSWKRWRMWEAQSVKLTKTVKLLATGCTRQGFLLHLVSREPHTERSRCQADFKSSGMAIQGVLQWLSFMMTLHGFIRGIRVMISCLQDNDFMLARQCDIGNCASWYRIKFQITRVWVVNLFFCWVNLSYRQQMTMKCSIFPMYWT